MQYRSRPAPELDPDADPAAVARSIVLRQLTNSPKSRKQLADKLAERSVPEDVADSVLDRFEEVQLVDDEAFAELWVRSRFQGRLLARSAIRRELSDRGIGGEIAETALGQVGDQDELDAARTLITRKLTPRLLAEAVDRDGRDKLVRRLVAQLARKGYPASTGFRIVAEALEAAAVPAPSDSSDPGEIQDGP